MKNILFFILLMTGVASGAAAQQLSFTSDTLHWSVESFTNTETQDVSSLASEFVINGSTISWIQPGAETVYEFTITDTEGIWTDAAEDGTITFQTTRVGNPVSIKFSRSGSVIHIETNYQWQGKNTMPFIFNVSLISKS